MLALAEEAEAEAAEAEALAVPAPPGYAVKRKYEPRLQPLRMPPKPLSKDSPDPAIAASSVLVSMTRVKDDWLITDFRPL